MNMLLVFFVVVLFDICGLPLNLGLAAESPSILQEAFEEWEIVQNMHKNSESSIAQEGD